MHLLRGTAPRTTRPTAPITLGPATKPEGLSPAASDIWDRLAPAAEMLGTLTASDVVAFTALVESVVTFERVQARKREGLDVARAEQSAIKTLVPLLESFGLTPPSRARLSPRAPAKPASKWDGLLTG